MPKIWRHLKPSTTDPNKKLIHACVNCDLAAVKKALDQGANVNCRSSRYNTPLLIAAENGDVDLIALLCNQPDIKIDSKSVHGSTALHTSVLLGQKDAMLMLLNCGARPDCRDNMGRQPLHHASFKKDDEAMEILIKYGARVDVYDAFLDSPLYYSVVTRPNVRITNLLLRNRASSNPPPSNTGLGLLLETVLCARVQSDFKAVETLISSGGDVNVIDPVAWRTPLHLCAINGQSHLAEYLIRQGADLYAKNRAGQTPLEVALKYRNLKVACLIEESRINQAENNSRHQTSE